MLRKVIIALAAVLAVSLIGTAVAVDQLLERVETPHQAYPQEGVFVDIQPGDSSPVIAARLAAAGVVRDVWTFRLAVWAERPRPRFCRLANTTSPTRCRPWRSLTRSQRARSTCEALRSQRV